MVSAETIILILLVIAALAHSRVAPFISRHRLVSYYLVPAGLLLLWLGLIVFYSYQIENVFTILTDEHSRSRLTSAPAGEIYQGQKITGSFTASQNYLGIVGFRFWTFYRLNDDYLIFRIREKNSLDWYYQNRYKADQFQPNQYFTFGFPVITDSQEKTYVFEIESSRGRPGVAVGVSELDPVFIAKYKYPRSLVTSTASHLAEFALLKLGNLLARPELKASSFIYLLPFILYLISLTRQYQGGYSKFLDFYHRELFRLLDFISLHRQPVSTACLLAGTFLDVLFIPEGDISILVLVTLWWITFRHYRLLITHFLALSGLFFISSFLAYYLNFPHLSERAGAWAWIFMALLVVIHLQSLRPGKSVPARPPDSAHR